MMRSRALKRIKKRTPGNRTVIHLRKIPGRYLLKTSTRIKKELLKLKVRK